ncbi:MAG: hypothetical protein R3D34_03630 [Nitratireductor sp.]
MKIKISPHDPDKVGELNLIDVIEKSLDLPRSDWTEKTLGPIARSKWAELYYSIAILYQAQGGYDWSKNKFRPYRCNIHVPNVVSTGLSTYINTCGRTKEGILDRLKLCLLLYDRIFLEEPISQLRFDHGYAPIKKGETPDEIYRLHLGDMITDRPFRTSWPVDWETIQKETDEYLYYERIKYWVLFYSKIHELISDGVVVPVSFHGDFYSKYGGKYMYIANEDTFDKEDGYRNDEDLIAGMAVSRLYQPKNFKKLVKKYGLKDQADIAQLLFVEQVLVELLLRQIDGEVAPLFDFCSGSLAFEGLKAQLQTVHDAKFESDLNTAQLTAFAPDPAGVSFSDLQMLRSSEEVFARWRAHLRRAARKSSTALTVAERQAFLREMHETQIVWGGEFDRFLSKNHNLASLFRDFGTKAVVGFSAAAGIGTFALSAETAIAAAGGYLSYDLLTSVNDYARGRVKDRTKFALHRIYASFEPK